MMETPFYVIHKTELDANLQNLKEALKNNWNNFEIGYSYKTNALPWLIEYYRDHGCFAEVVSAHEYSLAQRIGTKQGKLIYNGPIKTKETFLKAVKEQSIVNIDARRELEWLKEVTPSTELKLGLRVNFDIEKSCPGQSSSADCGGRFGFCEENGELEKAIDYIQSLGHTVKGLHLHISSKTRSVDIYRSSAKKACEIAKKCHLDLSFVDIGGGFFGGLPNKPLFSDYIFAIAKELKTTFSPATTQLIVEPGMALVGAPFSYVTSVIDVKDTTYDRFVVTDGSRTQIDPMFHKTSYFFEIEFERETKKFPHQVVCGYTCMENDRIFELNNEKELCVGDRITYHRVGAYTMCLTPLFIKYFPAVYVEERGKYTLVRREWTAEDYMQGKM